MVQESPTFEDNGVDYEARIHNLGGLLEKTFNSEGNFTDDERQEITDPLDDVVDDKTRLKYFLRLASDEEIRRRLFSDMGVEEMEKIRDECDFPLGEVGDDDLFYYGDPLRHYLSGQIDRQKKRQLIPVDGIEDEGEMFEARMYNLHVLLMGEPDTPKTFRHLSDEEKKKLEHTIIAKPDVYKKLVIGRSTEDLRRIKENTKIYDASDLAANAGWFGFFIDGILAERESNQ